MLFHLEILIRDNIGPDNAPAIRKLIGEQIVAILESGKVKDSGLYADERGGFFVIDVNAPEELLRLFAPIIDAIKVNAHPIISIELLPCYILEKALAKRAAELEKTRFKVSGIVTKHNGKYHMLLQRARGVRSHENFGS